MKLKKKCKICKKRFEKKVLSLCYTAIYLGLDSGTRWKNNWVCPICLQKGFESETIIKNYCNWDGDNLWYAPSNYPKKKTPLQQLRELVFQAEKEADDEG